MTTAIQELELPDNKSELLKSLKGMQNQRIAAALQLKTLKTNGAAKRVQVLAGQTTGAYDDVSLRAVDEHIAEGYNILIAEIGGDNDLFSIVASLDAIREFRVLTPSIRAADIANLIANYRTEIEAALAG